jgi:serine/threonine-protein kinase
VTPPAGADDELPERLAEYRILRELGAGAMGRVVLAEKDGERFALKLLHAHLMTVKGFFRRFQREAHAGMAIRHENVIRVHDCDFVMVGERPCAFLVMDYVEGCTLRQVLRDEGAQPEARVLAIARQVASGLAAVHGAGVVHRDLKPENLLIGAEGVVRIMDLGVARLLDATTRLTGEGQLAGSMLYASPEQLRGADPGPSSDLYSLGVVLHELVTGLNPFLRVHPAAIIDAHLSAATPDVRDDVPGVSPFLAGVIATLLEKSPAARFLSSAELRDVLSAGASSEWWARVRDRLGG